MRRLSDLGAWPGTRTRRKIGAAGREIIAVPAVVPKVVLGKAQTAPAVPPRTHVVARVVTHGDVDAMTRAIAVLTFRSAAVIVSCAPGLTSRELPPGHACNRSPADLTNIHRLRPGWRPPISGAP